MRRFDAISAFDVWTDGATWVSAIGTLIALLFAAIAALAAHRVYRIESERDEINTVERKRQAAFLRRAQAALVSAWWGRLDLSTDAPTWGAFIRNASETPVYQAHVAVVDLNDPNNRETFDVAVVPPATEPIVRPSQTRTGRDGSEPNALDHRVEMTFTDSTGIRWIRDLQGRLSEVLPELTIWGDTLRAQTLDRFTADFLASHQVRVRFRTYPIEVLREEFLAAVRSGQAPDVLVGPHDWIGYLVARHAIEPLTLTNARRQAFVDFAMNAMTYEGQLYGVPYAADSIALLRNLDLAPQPPTTVEEMIQHGRALCERGLADEALALQVGTGDCFHVYPLFTSAGGRLLHEPSEQGWDADGMLADGSRAAFARLGALGEQGQRILRREIDRERAFALFTQGRTPYLVCAGWAVGDARAAGRRHIGLSPMPTFAAGGPARSMVAVHGFFLANASANKSIAQDLIADYLTRTEVALALYEAQPRTPALRAGRDSAAAADASMSTFHELCEQGDLIPSTEDSVVMFSIFHEAERAIVAGEPVEAVLRRVSRALARARAGPIPTTPNIAGSG